ncbi:FRG domain-containing protein [Vibrio fluvialis]|uniref:FRG domain-containing protein n=1 Tax=Vibrio fluvialis TaxID=676 RepID=UPI003D7CE881
MEISSIQDLLGQLGRMNPDGQKTIWYRGQALAEWKLLPQYVRLTEKQSESTLLKRFKQSAAMLIANTAPKTSFDWLFLMQHYGVPTRLLDWSESPLVALYFAVENVDRHDEDGALWTLYPTELNKNAGIHDKDEEDYIPSFEDPELHGYSVESLKSNGRIQLEPIATIATRNNARIQAQQGVFTVHHNKPTPIEDIGVDEHTTKMTIPAAAKPIIKRQLAQLGYTKFQLFPELSSIGDIIKEGNR